MDGYTLEFEDLPTNKNRSSGGKAKKMAKNTNQAQATKPAKKYNKTRGEHYKDIVIAILVTGIVAFIGGAVFADKHNAEISRAVQAVTPTAEAAPVKK